jgi:hypothetical protein
LDAADAADKVVGEVLFSKDGMPPAEAGQSGLPAASQSEPAKE